MTAVPRFQGKLYKGMTTGSVEHTDMSNRTRLRLVPDSDMMPEGPSYSEGLVVLNNNIPQKQDILLML